MKIKQILLTFEFLFAIFTVNIYGQNKEPNIPIIDQDTFRWRTFAIEKNILDVGIVKELNAKADLNCIVIVTGKNNKRKTKIKYLIGNYLVKTRRIDSNRIHVINGAIRNDNEVEFRFYLIPNH